MTATETPPPAPLLGDVGCDENVNGVDAMLVLQLAARLIGTLACPTVAAVNGDGRTNSVDAALILQLDAGLIDRLPLA